VVGRRRAGASACLTQLQRACVDRRRRGWSCSAPSGCEGRAHGGRVGRQGAALRCAGKARRHARNGGRRTQEAPGAGAGRRASIETSVQEGVSGLKSGFSATATALDPGLETSSSAQPRRSRTRPRATTPWEGAGESWQSHRFPPALQAGTPASTNCPRESPGSSASWRCRRRRASLGTSTRRARA